MPRGRKSGLPAEQLAFLEEHFGEFEKQQAVGGLLTFWPKVTRLWFQKWPVELELGLPLLSMDGVMIEDSNLPAEHQLAVGKAQAARKVVSEIQYFEILQEKSLATGGGTSGSSATPGMQQLLKGLVQNHTRKWQRDELWQKLHPELVESALQAAGFSGLMGVASANETVEERQARIKMGRKAQLALRRKVVKSQIGAGTEEQLAELEALYEKQEVKGKAPPAAGPQRDINCEGIDKMGPLLREMHSILHATTGWVGGTVMTGPVPNQGGQIGTQSYCFGATPAGNTFEQAHARWDDAVTKPLRQFGRRVFDQEARQAVVLQAPPTTEAPAVEAPVIDVEGGSPRLEAMEKGAKRPRKRRTGKKQVVSKITEGYDTSLPAPMPSNDDADTDFDFGGGDDWAYNGADTAPGDIPIDPALLPVANALPTPPRPIPHPAYKGAQFGPPLSSAEPDTGPSDTKRVGLRFHLHSTLDLTSDSRNPTPGGTQSGGYICPWYTSHGIYTISSAPRSYCADNSRYGAYSPVESFSTSYSYTCYSSPYADACRSNPERTSSSHPRLPRRPLLALDPRRPLLLALHRRPPLAAPWRLLLAGPQKMLPLRHRALLATTPIWPLWSTWTIGPIARRLARRQILCGILGVVVEARRVVEEQQGVEGAVGVVVRVAGVVACVAVGAVIPLLLDTPPPITAAEKKAIRAGEMARGKAAALQKRLLHNDAGPHDLVIFPRPPAGTEPLRPLHNAAGPHDLVIVPRPPAATEPPRPSRVRRAAVREGFVLETKKVRTLDEIRAEKAAREEAAGKEGKGKRKRKAEVENAEPVGPPRKKRMLPAVSHRARADSGGGGGGIWGVAGHAERLEASNAVHARTAGAGAAVFGNCGGAEREYGACGARADGRGSGGGILAIAGGADRLQMRWRAQDGQTSPPDEPLSLR
ncbi:hypothetical protein B0H17DRAFT_1197421 [Mycena rosella]|uniref:Uncharacterized protein n=1 Tax=Mycena rosella TaxID=1033263 RepID=A0AAD7DRD5_MYCRO|nr:hypothetical protein B0H17DRAFT_1197421 [Mycena rosella]